MKTSPLWQIVCIVTLIAGTAGCRGTPQEREKVVAIYTAAAQTVSGKLTELSTVTAVSSTAVATGTPKPSKTQTRRSPTPCARDVCSFTTPFPLALPIEPPGKDSIEPSYRFGSTQNGRREPHHGVEFINKVGTPVLAAADGKVVVAGDDLSTAIGPYIDFYGNVVVLKHDLPGVAEPVFTLYGHLSKIMVAKGDTVKQGEPIGEVGLGGVAAGTHLHFEVRYGENSYTAVRNPELWLQPHTDKQGQPLGVLAGRLVDAEGNLLGSENIVLKQLDEKGKTIKTYYLTTYEETALLALPPWYDSFAISELPPGTYQISFIYKHEQKYKVQVLPGVVTYVYLRGE